MEFENLVHQTFNKLKEVYPIENVYLNIYPLYNPNTLGEANIYSKQIGISPTLFGDNVGTGYLRERKIQEKHNLAKVGFIKWIVCHEFAHVYYQTNKHTIEFFNNVEQMYLSI
ncbi:hypothetical protein ACNQGL_07770 [Flavobacterium sp. LB3P21]|uniref:hypothetical protein n=1 Tax=Flavobacterium sp. LB3P21 TaxID=3401719 RepID=UPI003AACD76F